MRLKRQLRKLTRWFREPPMQRPRTVSGIDASSASRRLDVRR
jgi:hypothetical protein